MPRFQLDAISPHWQVPPLDRDRKLLTGTAAGVAGELGIDPVYVRAAVIALSVAGGWGVLLYVGAWVVLFRRSRSSEPYVPEPKGTTPSMRMLGAAMLGLGLVILATTSSGLFLPVIAWPVALVSGALAVALGRGQIGPRHLGELRSNEHVQVRLGLGIVLLFGGVIAALALSFSFWQAVRSIVVAGVVLAGAALVFAPTLSRLANEALTERRMRIRSEERADMAAHLHDSVLQTLALIQKRSDDVSVVNLARRQERELRTWLFEEKDLHDRLGFRTELEQLMAQVEDLHQVPIEVVVVGDVESGPETNIVLRAAREAATNAARHSGAARIDVFADVSQSTVEVFVRDQGCGFDPDVVDSDRAGVRDSIIGRMDRSKGTAVITSSPGQGTEVELSVPLNPVPLNPAELQPSASPSSASPRLETNNG